MENALIKSEVSFHPRKNTLFEPVVDFDFFTSMPFCSHDLSCLDEGLLGEIFKEAVFRRQAGIGQLQSLIAPSKIQNLYFIIPFFTHSRYCHAMMMGMMTDVLVIKLNFPCKKVSSLKITAACHDIATPAGGDAVMSAFRELCEEKNFLPCLESHELVEKWKMEFGFDPIFSQALVLGKGKFSKLLDVLDKISYTILDCHYLGQSAPKNIANFLKRHLLFGEVWQDILLTSEGTVYFANAQRLFDFLWI